MSIRIKDPKFLSADIEYLTEDRTVVLLSKIEEINTLRARFQWKLNKKLQIRRNTHNMLDIMQLVFNRSFTWCSATLDISLQRGKYKKKKVRGKLQDFLHMHLLTSKVDSFDLSMYVIKPGGQTHLLQICNGTRGHKNETWDLTRILDLNKMFHEEGTENYVVEDILTLEFDICVKRLDKATYSELFFKEVYADVKRFDENSNVKGKIIALHEIYAQTLTGPRYKKSWSLQSGSIWHLEFLKQNKDLLALIHEGEIIKSPEIKVQLENEFEFVLIIKKVQANGKDLLNFYIMPLKEVPYKTEIKLAFHKSWPQDITNHHLVKSSDKTITGYHQIRIGLEALKEFCLKSFDLPLTKENIEFLSMNKDITLSCHFEVSSLMPEEWTEWERLRFDKCTDINKCGSTICVTCNEVNSKVLHPLKDWNITKLELLTDPDLKNACILAQNISKEIKRYLLDKKYDPTEIGLLLDQVNEIMEGFEKDCPVNEDSKQSKTIDVTRGIGSAKVRNKKRYARNKEMKRLGCYQGSYYHQLNLKKVKKHKEKKRDSNECMDQLEMLKNAS